MLKILPIMLYSGAQKTTSRYAQNLPIMLKLYLIVMKGYMIMMITMKEIMIVEIRLLY